MRYRALSPTGDFTFGQGSLNYLIDSPAAVAQVVETSLNLWLGEFFLNINDGTPYPEGVIGMHSQEQADATIKAQIVQCQGVVNIENYSSSIDPQTRAYSSISGTLNTVYGPTQLEITYQGDF